MTSSFAARYPAAVAMWHPTRNGDLRPQGVLAGSSVRVWWRCPAGPDHEWMAAPVVLGKQSIAKGTSGCPFCAGRRPSVTNSIASHRELAAEWHPTGNAGLRPDQVVAGGQRKYWWRCWVNPEHEWQASASNRVRGRGCPLCKKSLRSILEVCLAYELREFFPEISLVDDKVHVDGVVTHVDILIRSSRLIIEVDGRFHHSGPERAIRDRDKSAMLSTAGYRVMRVREAPLEQITDADVMMPADPTVKQTADAVLQRIRELGWAEVAKLDEYLSEPEPRWLSEALERLQSERPGQRLRLPGPVIMPRDERWDRGFELVAQFAQREGHSRVPDAHVESGVDVGSWVGLQRRRFSQGVLAPDRVERLESLPGWVWSAVESQWEDGYTHLIKYWEREGDIEVPAHHWEQDGFPLGSWVRSHRRRGGRRTLTAQQRTRLEALPGWTYLKSTEARWDKSADAMEVFARREGHCRMPLHHREQDIDIDSWSSNQRVRYHSGKLPSDRVARLELIPGWSWRPQEAAWERGFEILVSAAKAQGSAAVRRDLVWDGYPVGAWVGEQRNRRKDLSEALRCRLEELPGWTWSVLAESWDRHIEALQAFGDREGHAAVPTGHVELGLPLGSWVIRNRAERRQGILSATRVAQLETFPGWLWDPLADQWERNFRTLVDFVDRVGHARVPMTETFGGMALGQWVVTQRHAHRRGQLAPERTKRLESLLGWSWDAREAAWDHGLAALLAYKHRTGTVDVPRRWVEDRFPLGQWLGTQRSWQRAGRLRPDRALRLMEVLGTAAGLLDLPDGTVHA